MLPNLSSLVSGSTKRPRGSNSDHLQKLLVAISEFDDDNDLSDVVDPYRKLEDLNDDEISTIGNDVVVNGRKILIAWFLGLHPNAIDKDLPRNATAEWWNSRFELAEFPSLSLKRDAGGLVTVDLWHARRGTIGPASFSEFRANYPTFFLGSRAHDDHF